MHKAARQGYSEAQCGLGLCYMFGRGVAINKSEAVRWFREAAEQGDAMAQTYLGRCYLDGEGVTINKEEALKWLQKAADQGFEEAKELLRHYAPRRDTPRGVIRRNERGERVMDRL